MQRIFTYIVFITLLNVVGTIYSVAQTDGSQTKESVDVTVRVSIENDKKEAEYRAVQYVLCKNKEKAEALIPEMQATLKKQSGDDGQMDDEAWDKFVVAKHLPVKKSKMDGSFKVHVRHPQMAILICTYDPDDPTGMSIVKPRFHVVVIEPGKTEYTVDIKDEGMTDDIHTIDEVKKIGTNKGKLVIKPTDVVDDDANLYFRISFSLPAGYGNERARLVVQPVAVDCQNEDTVAYTAALVMEGAEYHMVQDKNMLFDYLRNDKVAAAFIDTPMWHDEDINIDTLLVWKKQDKKKTYKIPYKIEIADLNHVYFDQESSTGSCNSKNIFKFLDLGLAAADMKIDEFELVADANTEDKEQDIPLKFEVGKSQLTKDSINNVKMSELVTELKSYGDRLDRVAISATASPDGGYDANLKLARERTQTALATVKRLLGRNSVYYERAEPRVCTWFEVAHELELQGYNEIAEQIRTYTGSNGYGGDANILKIQGYQEYVEPVLENLRKMNVRYTYEREHIMDANEVMQAYHVRKHDMLTGKDKGLSSGDYYNLFVAMTDSAEIDTLTTIAYKYATAHKGYEQIKFNMYVANKMAVLNLKRGTPDTQVLKPFINESLKVVQTRTMNSQPQKNRREILINQIITLFQAAERDSALSYLQHWFQGDKDEKVMRMRKFITFKDGFLKYTAGMLPPDKAAEVKDAMDFVISCAPDNKAVIYTESREALGVTYDESLNLINNMSDANPKKWYLRGILEAQMEAKTVDKKRAKNYIPNYLCFFNHAIEMMPSYKWLYFNDGQVIDGLREKYMYDKHQKPKYRQMFNNLVGQLSVSGPDQNDVDAEDSVYGDEEETENISVNNNDAAK